MSPLPLVSIIILNFNGKRWFKECFESLEKLNYPRDRFEVILGDNASTDDSVEHARLNYPWVKIIRFDGNYGFCRSNNECAKQAKGEYLVFLNNDTFVTSDWLSRLVEGALSEPGIVSCASKIMFPFLKDKKLINAAGGVISPSGGGTYTGWLEEDGPVYNVPQYTAFGCGAGVLVQKNFFLETDGFDEYYFYSGEESDLGFRAWLLGYKVLYVPGAVMYHYMGQTGFRGNGITPTIEFLVTRNTLYFLFKNFGLFYLLKGVFYCFLRSLSKIAYTLLHGNIHIPAVIFKAYGAVLCDFSKILKIRSAVQKARKISDRELSRRGVIISNLEAYRINFHSLRNAEKYFKASYDMEDSVEVDRTPGKEWVFRKKQ